MRVSIHQPNYVPWIGYFRKISSCDVFVVLDNVQYTKNGFVNRNRIKTTQGEKWLTIPVGLPSGLHSLISQVSLRDDLNWREKHLKTLQTYYGRARYFSEIFEIVRSVLDHKETLLWRNNINLIRACCSYLQIETPMVLASDLLVDGSKNDLLISIVKRLGGDVYIAGTGSKEYSNPDEFASQGIELRYCNYPKWIYPQLWGEFIPHLSILDLLFNCGRRAHDIVVEDITAIGN